VRGASSGEAAIEAVTEARPDLVLMDISMPGIDGFEATRRIRALPGCDDLPILALTAYASSRERGLAEEAGMNGYLTKPVKRSRLASALGEWLPAGAPSAAPVDGASLVDDGVLRELGREIGSDNLVLVIGTFTDEARERWAALAATDTPEALAREAHSLISTCLSFGLRAVAEDLVAMEREAREGRYPARDTLEHLGAQLDAALAALGDWTGREQENVGA
jgi:CheY-like chemotaxis protein